MPRIVDGLEWTQHGGWVVVATWMGAERVVFDPEDAGSAEDAHRRCVAWVERTLALIAA